MSDMKKHPFLQIELVASVRLSEAEIKRIKKIFEIASQVMQGFMKRQAPLRSKEKFNSMKLSLLLCGDTRIRKLNREARAKDKVTDVLSFPFHEDLRKNAGPVVLDQSLYLGEMAICHSQAKRRARSFKIDYSDEFTHLLIHGIFHLLGYDHERSLQEEKLMQLIEDQSLAEFSKIKKKIKRKGS